ncbi:hypothetical protein LY02_00454 [Nonlabens ulvanivorans]|uniref:Lipoprotein n=2 Tax=Nonlabens ulvanivorans TaxID=906888 RepID=A0ABX5E891_NONUL|nr:hypothetical protein LY02_00454 [Nonlabens ulvanivorans]
MAMLSITSCEKDDTPLETIQEQPQFKIEKLTGSQLTNNHSLNKALSGAKESLGINTFQKSVYDSINGFYIEDTDVNYLSSGTYESYTFKITDPSDTTHLKNMVFSKQMDSTYQAFIVAYDLNYITLDDIRQGSIPVDATPYVRYTPVTSSFQHKNGVVMIGEGDCVSFAEVSPARNCTVDDHAPGEACDLDEGDWRRAQEATLVFYMEPCGGGDLLPSDGDLNLGGDFPSDPGPPTGGQTNPGGSGQLTLINNNTNEPDEPCNDQLTLSNGDCAGVITSPVIDLKPAPEPVDDDTQTFFDDLPDDLREFINDSDQDDLRNEIDEFFESEGDSQENKHSVEEYLRKKKEDPNYSIWDDAEFVAPDTPIQDMDEYLDCFDTSQPAVLTIYVDEPWEGSGFLAFPGARLDNGAVGHAFIGISQGNHSATYGFYPNEGAMAAPLNSEDIGRFGDDSNTKYDISISIPINSGQLNDIINASKYPNQQQMNGSPNNPFGLIANDTGLVYNTHSNNCTDFALDAGASAGLDFGNTSSILPTTMNGPPGSQIYIKNPGKLGEKIRNQDFYSPANPNPNNGPLYNINDNDNDSTPPDNNC